ncbi:MAG TPA: cob(I)yrinic acid a,c-diamide adenosyltransferase, partial [Candidatus Mediterraneibacter gallistercoris]|nr:cob(I)yrinic acid a,c-diamide adenosyltransferase [Candidatus Mediterraneibacter gallistercoris]
LWRRILEMAADGSYDILVMDEFMAAYRYGLIPREEALTFLREKPAGLEVVLTGRDPDERLVELADYVSEIRKVKHPFDRGIRARRGIEY